MIRPAHDRLAPFIAMLTIVGSGCGSRASSERPRHDLSAKALEIRDRMHQRFTASRRLELAIAFGRIDAARAEAGSIARLAEPEMLPEWQPYVEQIRASAQEIERAPDLGVAAMISAALGQRCARCHEASGARIVFAEEDRPAAGDKLPSRMASHQWAATRLWEGLVGPSHERWRAGAGAMADAPLAIVAEGDGLPPDLAVSDDVGRIRLLATRALGAQAADDRAALYGQLLSTCVRCHAKIRDR